MTKNYFYAYLAAFNRKDFATFGAYCSDDVVLDLSGKRILRGSE